MTLSRRETWFKTVGWLCCLIAIGLILGALLRFYLLEDVTQVRLCESAASSVLCRLRSLLGWSIYHQLFGLSGALLAIFAWLPRLRGLAWPGLVMSCLGLVLYNTTYAGVGFTVALLSMLRSVPAHASEEGRS